MHYSKNSKNWDIEIMYFSCHKKEAFFVKFIFLTMQQHCQKVQMQWQTEQTQIRLLL